jgi:hypothetical protein
LRWPSKILKQERNFFICICLYQYRQGNYVRIYLNVYSLLLPYQ